MILSEKKHIKAIKALTDSNQINIAYNIISKTLSEGSKILFCGNGGSAADSNHMAAEFVGRFEKDRKPLNAISLSSNISLITSIANDFGFEYIFSRQIEAIGNSGDVLIAISTSGTSKNIIEAIKLSKEKQLNVIFITGDHNIEIISPKIHMLQVKSKNTATIQEVYMYLLHNFVRNIE